MRGSIGDLSDVVVLADGPACYAGPVASRDETPHTEPTAVDLLQLDIDLRIGADLWVEASEIGEWNEERLWAFLRFAYGRGYHDALTEPQRGKLCRDHGLGVPRRERER